MKLLICLGNPGEKYAKTRHNVGFMFADVLAKELNCGFKTESKFKCDLAKGIYKDEAIWIMKPLTYMNLSGDALSALKNYYKINTEDILLVYDDIVLELGTIRFKPKGSDGGHNGVKSIIKHLGSNVFNRLKIGIGLQPSFVKSEDYVLQNFSKDEFEVLETVLQRTLEAFCYFCENDISKVQNKYN